jgi:hypothetical protein
MADPPAKKILDLFKSSKKWDFDRYAIDRHRGFFVRRRAAALGHDHADWLNDPMFLAIMVRIGSELTEVENYLVTKLGPLTRDAAAPASSTTRGPLYGGPGDATPPHLDLADVAQIKTHDPAGTVANAIAHPKTRTDQRARNYLDERKDRVLAIVWRAAALHQELWLEALDQKTATLMRDRMDFLLDRRLRVVEHMNYRVASHGSMDVEDHTTSSEPKLTGPVGPWIDGYRVRCMEYPRAPNNKAYRAVIGPANIGPPNAAFDDYPWVYSGDRKKRRLEYNKGPRGYNFNGVLEPDLTYDNVDEYSVQITPTDITAAEIMDEFVRPDEDFWSRSWIFCDHAATALNLEALLFGLRRRDHDSPAAFNTVVTGHPPGYVEIGYVLVASGKADFGQIMADRHDQYFENTEVAIDDFQVGDHVVFYNSYVYRLISSNDWRLENTFVMGVDSDPDRDSGDPPDSKGKHRWKNMKLQGHGTGLKVYAGYVDEIRATLQVAINNAYDMIASAPAAAQEIPIGSTRLVNWTPYEKFSTPAWWVEVPLKDKSGKVKFASPTAARNAVQKTVMAEQTPPPAGGYTPPPKPANAVYFPLYEPQFQGDGGWAAYLAKRAQDASVKPPGKVPNKLRKVVIDGSIMPGFFYRGTSFPTPAVRPKAWP